MSRYDGLIIPRSYSEYINKTDAATLSQALQLSSVMDATPTQNSNKPAKSSGIFTAIDLLRPKLIDEEQTTTFEVPIGNVEIVLLDWRGYAGYYWIGLILSYQSGVNMYPISTNITNFQISTSGHNVTVSYEGQTPMVTRYKMNNVNFY